MLNIKTNVVTLTDISLAKHKIWNINGDRRGDVITCLNGRLWITQEGDMKDYVIEPGHSFWVTKPGAVVAQALEDALFKYSLSELHSHIEAHRQPSLRFPRTRMSNHAR